jgi:peroxiredoxin
MAKTPQVGEPAPDFELPGTDGPFRLSEHRGERVVLLFYPGDNPSASKHSILAPWQPHAGPSASSESRA